jgi:Antitoxin FitA-like, ribbon-helix-helix
MATLNIKDFPDELYHILGQRAKKNRRSLTSEVIYLLEWAIGTFSERKSSILRLRGLGKKHWKGVDVTQHVEIERESWENT